MTNLHIIKGSYASQEYILDGLGSELPVGLFGFLVMEETGILVVAELLGDGQTGDLVVDIYKTDYADFPPDSGDSICGGNPLTIASAKKTVDTDLSGWDRQVNRGDIYGVNVDSVTTITRATVHLKIKR